MEPNRDPDELEPYYDFRAMRGVVRGRYFHRFQEGNGNHITKTPEGRRETAGIGSHQFTSVRAEIALLRREVARTTRMLDRSNRYLRLLVVIYFLCLCAALAAFISIIRLNWAG